MIHVFYQRFPFGSGEAFAEEELNSLAEIEEKITVYCYSEKTSTVRKTPENCNVINLFDATSSKTATIISFLKLFSIRTLKEIVFMSECGYKFDLKHLKRIFQYYRVEHMFVKKKLAFAPGDIIYSYWLSDIAYPLSEIKRKKTDLRFVSRAHGYDMYADRGYNPFRREIIGALDMLYCINESGRKDILDHYGDHISPDKVKTAHLGVLCPEKAPERVFNTDKCVIVSCSNIIQLKRIDLLIEALSKLDINVDWYHFGSGSLETTIKNTALDLLSNKDNVKYSFMGQTKHDEVLRFLREEKVDLFVNCSDYEGIPVSIMEAMAYGIPCIARNVGGISEVLDNENGILLEKNIDAGTLSKAILSYYGLSYDEKLNKSHSAAKKIFDEFNCKKNYSAFASELKGKERYGGSNAE